MTALFITKNPDRAPEAAEFHCLTVALVSSEDCEAEPVLVIAGISWLMDTSLQPLTSHPHGISPVSVSKWLLFI